MTEIDNIVEMLGEGYEGLEDVHIDISMLEYDDDDKQCNEVIHGNAVTATARELLFSSSSNRRNSQKQGCPFVLKIYEMLADIQFKSLISWTNNGTSFIIHDNHRFAVEVLPRFFRHNNLSSFICQLNCYVSIIQLILVRYKLLLRWLSFKVILFFLLGTNRDSRK